MNPTIERLIPRQVREFGSRIQQGALERILFERNPSSTKTHNNPNLDQHETEAQPKPLKVVAIIPDGNRRWAISHGLRPEEGMDEGAKAMLRLFPFFIENPDIETVYAWAFSTDNWGRPPEQIDAVMQVVERTIIQAEPLFHKHGIRFKRFGRESEIRNKYPTLWQACLGLEERTKDYRNKRFGLLLDFGGEDQELRIAQKLKQKVLDNPDIEVTNELLISLRDGAEEGFKPADAVVRTSGEQRTSGMGWIAEKAEFISIEHNIPDSDKNDGNYVLEEYSRRQIRNGR